MTKFNWVCLMWGIFLLFWGILAYQDHSPVAPFMLVMSGVLIGQFSMIWGRRE